MSVKTGHPSEISLVGLLSLLSNSCWDSVCLAVTVSAVIGSLFYYELGTNCEAHNYITFFMILLLSLSSAISTMKK